MDVLAVSLVSSVSPLLTRRRVNRGKPCMKKIKEEWRNVVGYEGLYEVSNLGNVRNQRKRRLSTTPKNKRNYVTVHLQKDGIGRGHGVHRLVMNAFVPNIFNKREVNHIDGNPSNNQLSNLEWNTTSENTRHAWKMGLQKTLSSTKIRYVYKEKDREKYGVIVTIEQNRLKRVGRFRTLKEAIEARNRFILGNRITTGLELLPTGDNKQAT